MVLSSFCRKACIAYQRRPTSCLGRWHNCTQAAAACSYHLVLPSGPLNSQPVCLPERALPNSALHALQNSMQITRKRWYGTYFVSAQKTSTVSPAPTSPLPAPLRARRRPLCQRRRLLSKAELFTCRRTVSSNIHHTVISSYTHWPHQHVSLCPGS